jgi:hypothetical protein
VVVGDWCSHTHRRAEGGGLIACEFSSDVCVCVLGTLNAGLAPPPAGRRHPQVSRAHRHRSLAEQLAAAKGTAFGCLLHCCTTHTQPHSHHLNHQSHQTCQTDRPAFAARGPSIARTPLSKRPQPTDNRRRHSPTPRSNTIGSSNKPSKGCSSSSSSSHQSPEDNKGKGKGKAGRRRGGCQRCRAPGRHAHRHSSRSPRHRRQGGRRAQQKLI